MKKAILGIVALLVILSIWSKSKQDQDVKRIDELAAKAQAQLDKMQPSSGGTGSAAAPAPEQPKADPVIVKKLAAKFRQEKDEFEGKSWYYHKSAPRYVNRNGIFAYFQVSGGQASNLRFKHQYTADDWLFIKEYDYLIDGKTYVLIPDEVKRDNGDGEIWEWFDIPAQYDAGYIVNALASCKTAKVKLIGQNYYHITQITPAQISAIKETVDLYRAMGGE